MNTHHLKKAVACYQNATRINPYDYRGYYSLALVYASNVNDPLAHYYFMRAVSLQFVYEL